jgi:hypothetical protein
MPTNIESTSPENPRAKEPWQEAIAAQPAMRTEIPRVEHPGHAHSTSIHVELSDADKALLNHIAPGLGEPPRERAYGPDPIFAPSRLGQTVRYCLSDDDVKQIIENRRAAGTGVARGNDPRAGQAYPAIVVRDWADAVTRMKNRQAWRAVELGAPGPADLISNGLTEEQFVTTASCNLQVMLDGNDTYWATSRTLYRADAHPSPKGHFIDRWIDHDWPVH